MSEISFYSRDLSRDYYSANEPDEEDLEDEDEIVLTQDIFITNDEDDELYYFVKVNREQNGGMTRRQLMKEISRWLSIRNLYYNIRSSIEHKEYVDSSYKFDITRTNEGLDVHCIRHSGEYYKDTPVYNMIMST